MSRWIPWFILGVISLFILLSYHYYTAGAGSAKVAPEPFTSPPLRGNLNDCTVYFTSNVDICNRPPILTVTSAEVDTDTVNYYAIGKDEVIANINRINAVAAPTRTAQQSSALVNLKRVLADIDTLPFKNTCKLEMPGLKESSAHPRKINQAYDGTDRRGNPLHWAFCYYNTANDTAPPPNPSRITPTLRASAPFQRVFQDTTVDYRDSSDTLYRRYDMKSMQNDDLLNLHCALYTESLIQGGNAVSAFNNTRMMELTLVASEVLALSGASGDTRLTITRMRPVKVSNGVLVVEPAADISKSDALSLIEIIRTQTALVHRQKSYSPTLYKLLFHLCSATTSQTVSGGAPAAQMVYDKYIQLMVPKPLNASISQIMRFNATHPNYTTTGRQIYDFYASPPYGDISDMVFDIATLDRDKVIP